MTERFDEVVHAPNRLRICALLAASSTAEFAVLRDILGVADSVLSKHLKVLQDAGYVAISKPTGRGRVKTWVSLTAEGRRAYAGHVQALKTLIDTPGIPVGSSEAPDGRR
ncbi:DNA-binding MarR family transcriptional regulator [Thermocatellispora tengchongensis]|uniref:DNA-binding MarR family transcriptional regulator n=1 Tax=Thermocatellispora tengchongensis TaxID=1073253 RepID=A0A840PA22_9ACTN|nr:transcriptional regulator [Thermocatellispora tengchongensis]MBB5134773.1 DNA-binding MarR family transcriptional regulator [Thermocatellispora tengchongensis]